MGTVALTAQPNAEGVFSGFAFEGAPSGRSRRFLVAGSASYATGGDTVPLATLGLRNVTKLLIEPWGAGAESFQPGCSIGLAGTPGAPLLKYFDAVGVEVTAATNLASRNVLVFFVGD